MIISIHQPNYLPYLGFFDKMARSDIFVIYDDAQFTDREFFHRNKIKMSSGWKWITVPLYDENVPINKIRIKNNVFLDGSTWYKDHFRKICENYKKAPYYESYAEDLKKIYSKKFEKLIDLNMCIIDFFVKVFDINVEIVYSSSFELESKSTEKLVDIVKSVGGDVYLSGAGGHNYIDQSLFKDIKLVFQDYKHPVYKQLFSGFIPNMAAIDALFNTGGMP
jgi:hypothetical protein